MFERILRWKLSLCQIKWLSTSNLSVKDLTTLQHLGFNVYHDMGQSEELTFGIQILEFITHDKNIKIYPDVYVEEWQVLK